MRLLFVTSHFPLPVTNGLALRTSSVLTALSELGHEIHLISFGRVEDANNAEACRICRSVRVIPHLIGSQAANIDYWGRLRTLLRRLPHGTQFLRSTPIQAAIETALRDRQVDAVLCDTLDTMINLPERCPVPVILNSHNVEHRIIRRFAEQERNLAKRAYARVEAAKLRRWERQACRRADIILVCSEQDRQALRALCPDRQFAVVPNVVDTRAYAPCTDAGGATLLYTGGMDWYPNRDAVEFFVFSILPLIRERVPEAKFMVAGRNPSPEFLERFEGLRGIEFTGTVPDMMPYLATATVCVVPLRIGSGTRLKILEAGAMAKAIVSTSLGAEGLNFADGNEIVLADEPASFAKAVVELLRDPSRRQHMGAAARHRVEQDYSYPVLKNSLEPALQTLAGPTDSYFA